MKPDEMLMEAIVTYQEFRTRGWEDGSALPPTPELFVAAVKHQCEEVLEIIAEWNRATCLAEFDAFAERKGLIEAKSNRSN